MVVRADGGEVPARHRKQPRQRMAPQTQAGGTDALLPAAKVIEDHEDGAAASDAGIARAARARTASPATSSRMQWRAIPWDTHQMQQLHARQRVAPIEATMDEVLTQRKHSLRGLWVARRRHSCPRAKRHTGPQLLPRRARCPQGHLISWQGAKRAVTIHPVVQPRRLAPPRRKPTLGRCLRRRRRRR